MAAFVFCSFTNQCTGVDMLDNIAVNNLARPLQQEVETAQAAAAEAARRAHDPRYSHEPFGWARVMLEEGLTPRP